jgi:cold shock CspA family protein
VHSHDKGYGIIEDASGQEVYLSHERVEKRRGFDDLRQGEQLEYTSTLPNLRVTKWQMISKTGLGGRFKPSKSKSPTGAIKSTSGTRQLIAAYRQQVHMPAQSLGKL